MRLLTYTYRSFNRSAFLALTVVVGSLASATQPKGSECATKGTDGPMQITTECTDPQYDSPIYTGHSDENLPIPHRKVSGYFNGTEVDFNIYLPHEGWDGRFFQLVFPTQNSIAKPEAIGFGAESGGYTLHVAGTGGYRSDAAAAKLSREIAGDYYQQPNRHIYGYIYGGSGGSFETAGAMENTFGIWDGGVILIQGVPTSNPDDFSIAALGGLVLENKSDQLIDAVRPGGRDPYQVLNAVESSVFEEITALGLPPKAWEDFDGVGRNRTQVYESLRATATLTRTIDPTYPDDFWSKPGYIGGERSELGDIFRAARVDFNTTVRKVNRGSDNIPVTIELDSPPKLTSPRNWYDLTLQSHCDGVEDGSKLTGQLDSRSTTVYIYPDNNSTVSACLKENTSLRVDNSWYLSLHSIHRHELPTREGFRAYDYLRNKDGTPRYPRRKTSSSTILSQSVSGGATHTGNITAKVIVMDNLLDNKAFPWQADWYRSQVQQQLGDRFNDNYRLYYSDNADHEMGVVADAVKYRLIDFTGLYEQHLRDLSAWVENGTEPPSQTRYTIENSQVEVPETASERRGIQPIAHFTVQNNTRAEVAVGSTVTLQASIEVPQGAGEVVSIEWDFYGNADFVKGDFGVPRQSVHASTTHTYTTPGVYFPSIRVASHRSGNLESPYAKALNLGRARVIVK